METKFKKGDRVVARMQDAFGFFKAGDEGKVEHIGTNRAEISINGRAFTTTFRGIEGLFDLVAEPIDLAEGERPRLASDMTIREEIASRIYCSLIKTIGNSHGKDYLLQETIERTNALINALNEKP